MIKGRTGHVSAGRPCPCLPQPWGACSSQKGLSGACASFSLRKDRVDFPLGPFPTCLLSPRKPLVKGRSALTRWTSCLPRALQRERRGQHRTWGAGSRPHALQHSGLVHSQAEPARCQVRGFAKPTQPPSPSVSQHRLFFALSPLSSCIANSRTCCSGHSLWGQSRAKQMGSVLGVYRALQ